MKIKIDDKNKVTIISEIEEFDLMKTLRSGQTFRYFETEDGVVVINKKIATLLKTNESGDLIVHSVDKVVVDTWIKYFNLETDYVEIKNKIIKIEKKMKDVVESSSGVRIIKQDEWETIVSFILSANNNIKRITKLVNLIAETYGDLIGVVSGVKCYSFPTPDKLIKLKEQDLRKLGVGFRDKYLIDAATKISSGEIKIDELSKLDAISLKNELMKIKGIGNKVADCIRLIGFNKIEAFPVDVWIERFMIEYFLNDGNKYTREKIEVYGMEKFKDVAGYAQQYMFYYCITEYKKKEV